MTSSVRKAQPVHVETDARAKAIPSALILVGLGLYVAGAFAHVGASGVAATLAGGLILAAVQTVLLIAAAFLASMTIGVSFGEVGLAVLKFAGISLFCGGLAALLPAVGLLSLLVFLGLIVWLFEVELVYAIVLTFAYWLVSLLVVGLIRAIA